eukprot:g2350.t1
MFKILAPTIVCFVALLGAFHASIDRAFFVGAGYGAKIACSIVYVGQRNLESALEAELKFPPIKYLYTISHDERNKCVSASFFSYSRTACFRSATVGCSLTWPPLTTIFINPFSPQDLISTPAPRSKLWPVGDSVLLSQTSTDEIDWNRLNAVVDNHFNDSRLKARALLIVKNGKIVFEKYGDDSFQFTPEHRQLGWSATKSIFNALVGVMIQQGLLPNGVNSELKTYIKEWQGVGNLTVGDMLRMQDGTDFDEYYFPLSDVPRTLFYEKSTLLKARKSRVKNNMKCWQYNSHTTNVLALFLQRILEEKFGKNHHYSFLQEHLFKRINANSFIVETDPSGAFIASSFGWATPRDWARLGLLFLNDGIWNGERILPEGWVKFSSTPTTTSFHRYGSHFWLGGNKQKEKENQDTIATCDKLFPSRVGTPDRGWWDKSFPPGTFGMHGFESQMIGIVPQKKIVLVRMGATKEVVVKWNRVEFYSEIMKSFPDVE